MEERSYKWRPMTEVPKNGSYVAWIAPSGDEVKGKWYSGLWFIGEMYIYYMPLKWRYQKPEELCV
jgi:hypothetical protein